MVLFIFLSYIHLMIININSILNFLCYFPRNMPDYNFRASFECL